MAMGGWRMRWLFNRRVCLALLWMILLLAIVIIVNAVGIHLAGSIDSWQQWMNTHAGFFFVWRLLLYAITIYGWLWMRRRLLNREPHKATHQRLLRMEIAAVIAILVLEISPLLQTE